MTKVITILDKLLIGNNIIKDRAIISRICVKKLRKFICVLVMTLIVFQIYSNMNIAIVIKWKLNRLIKNEWIGMDDILMEPVDGFTSKLNASFFCNEMNSNN